MEAMTALKRNDRPCFQQGRSRYKWVVKAMDS